MIGNVPFLMKDLVLLSVSFYLLKQDLMRASRPAREADLPIIEPSGTLDPTHTQRKDGVTHNRAESGDLQTRVS